MNLKSIITVQTLEKFYTGIKNLFASKTELSEGLALKSDKGHAHDDRYYTESEINTKLEGKANSSHGTHVPTPQTADNKKFLRNDNTWQEVTPSNIGAAPTSHTHDDRYYTETETAEAINTAKATLQASINAKADKEHGSHVPTPQASDNAKFLRNDNTWQKVVPANIGAADREHEHTQYIESTDMSTHLGVHYQEVIKPALDLKQDKSSALTLGTTSSTAYRGDYGNTAYTHSQAAHAPSNAQKNSDITKSEIEAKLTGDIGTHTHNGQYYTETEIDTKLAAVSNAAYSKTEVDTKLALRDRLHASLIPSGTEIPANADLNSIDYIKVGSYYCLSNANAGTLANCPTNIAFMMEVLSPIHTGIDDETTRTWVYRLRRITLHNTGEQYTQLVSSGGTKGSFTYGEWNKVALKSEINTAIETHAHDNLYYKKSEVDTKLSDVADVRRILYKGNVGSTATYFPLANFVADSSNNYGHLTFSGRMGRWENIGAANFEMMLLNRSNAKDGNTITSTVSAAGEVATALGVTDIVIFKQDDLSAKAYIKATGYVIWDLTYSFNQHSVVYDGTSSTETPAGELIWSLSTANKTILSPTGALSQTGAPTKEADLTTKSYVDGVIGSHRHARPQPGNYFVDGYAGMTPDGVMECGKYQDWHNASDASGDYSVRIQCVSDNGNTVNLPSQSGTLALISDCGAFLNRNNDLNTVESNKAHKMQFAQTSGNADMMPDTSWWSLIRLQHGGYDAGYWQDIAVSFGGEMKVRYNQNGTFGPWRQVMFTDNMWIGTQEEYDAISNKNPNVLYLIKE